MIFMNIMKEDETKKHLQCKYNWLDIWKKEPPRNEEILFKLGNEEIHIGEIFSEEKLRECQFYSFVDKCYYDCDSVTPMEEKVTHWHPLPK